MQIIEVEMPDIDSQKQQQHPATPQSPHPSFQSLSPVRTLNPPPPSVVTSPPRRPPLETEDIAQSAPPPSVDPDLNKDVGGVPSEFEANYNSIQG